MPYTPIQRKVIKVLSAGGSISVKPPKYKRRFKLLDAQHNPMHFVHGLTIRALEKHKLVTINKQAACYTISTP
jgi:hypothetical protein